MLSQMMLCIAAIVDSIIKNCLCDDDNGDCVNWVQSPRDKHSRKQQIIVEYFYISFFCMLIALKWMHCIVTAFPADLIFLTIFFSFNHLQNPQLKIAESTTLGQRLADPLTLGHLCLRKLSGGIVHMMKRFLLSYSL